MKLEKLESSKFDAFKENELQNAFRIVGGVLLQTRPISGPGGTPGCDTHDTATDDPKNPMEENKDDTKDCASVMVVDTATGTVSCEWQPTNVVAWYPYEFAVPDPPVCQ